MGVSIRGGGGGGEGGDQGGCERRIEVEVFGKIHKKKLELMFMKHYAPNRCLYYCI